MKNLLFNAFLIIFHHYVMGDNARVYKIQSCDANKYYPVNVKNVVAEERNRKVFVSGSLTTDDDLNSPISASLTVKRYIELIQVWIPVACIDGIGSCTYNDLCSYGVSQNASCPNNFLKNNVPCRCPISEGTYTMQPEKKMYLFTVPKMVHLGNSRFGSPVAGTYWVQVEVTNDITSLACYQLYIDYNDEIFDFEQNEIVPSVHLI